MVLEKNIFLSNTAPICILNSRLEISKINQQVCLQQLYYTNVLVLNKRVVDPITFKSFPYGFYEAT